MESQEESIESTIPSSILREEGESQEESIESCDVINVKIHIKSNLKKRVLKERFWCFRYNIKIMESQEESIERQILSSGDLFAAFESQEESIERLSDVVQRFI